METRSLFMPALLGSLCLLGAGESAATVNGSAAVTHGVAAGDVDGHSAVIWSRADRAAEMHVRVKDSHGGAPAYGQIPVAKAHDYTGKVRLDGLKPDTVYDYQVWFGDGRPSRHGDAVTEGRFRTAPAASDAKPVEFAWGGDLAGQNVCRDAVEGFPIFDAINRMHPDFFVGLGDMIYADGTCGASGGYGNPQMPGGFGPAADMDAYWAHWKYNREDDGYRRLLAAVPYFAIWDDHEVVNDFGPLHDSRDTPPYISGAHLMPLGRAAFLDYNPVAEPAATPKRLYRNVRWGKNVELFILDTRQYRDANSAADDPTRPKTMLGREQLVWLKERLKASDATWKIIVSSVPMSIPTGYPPANGRDGWANYDQDTGFENELMDILGFMRDKGMRNIAWITTDVHFAEAFRYTPFSDDPAFQVYEFVAGPLNAGLFPNRDFDPSLNGERLYFYGPDNGADVTNYEQAKSWMNFGHMRFGDDGAMTVSIRDVAGKTLYETTVAPRR